MPPYQGARAQTDAKAVHRVFAVSKVRLDANGGIKEVPWAEMNPKSNLAVSAAVKAPVSEVDAIHAGHDVIALFEAAHATRPEQAFVIVDHSDGYETLTLDGPEVPGREIRDILALPPGHG